MDKRILPGLEIPRASLVLLSVYQFSYRFRPMSTCVYCQQECYQKAFWDHNAPENRRWNGAFKLQYGAFKLQYGACRIGRSQAAATRQRTPAHGQAGRDRYRSNVHYQFVTQYLLGMIDVFSLVGTQEFFYDQVLTEPRSIGLAPSLSAMGLSSFQSDLLIILIDWDTGRNDG